MTKNKFFISTFYLSVITAGCVGTQTKNNLLIETERCPAQINTAPIIRLVPQEIYGDEVLSLLDRKGADGTLILQFNFFTDNKEKTYPKKIAQKLINIRKQNSTVPILVALESRKDAGDQGGKGAAQRNAKTKKLLSTAGIEVRNVFGHSRELQNPPGREDGVSHTKLIMAGNEIIAGSNNLTKQSTDVGANNEMNLSVQSEKISNAVRDYVTKIIAKPGQMVDIDVEDGNVRLLTDRLHFDELLSQIKRAQKGDQIGLSMYQFLYRNENDQQARQVFEELLAAHKRGAQLEIYLNRAEDLSIQNTEANLRVAELLMKEGVSKVYFDPVAKISHSKFLYRISALEKVALVSSVNIYRGDFNDNHQLTWVIKDSSITDQLVSYFKQQIAYDGVLVGRIPKDPLTGLRYKVVSQNPEKTIWNKPVPAMRMLRFWRGFKQDDVSSTKFESNVNARLIPETIEVGGRRGLNAYLPSFFPEGKPDFLPDEVAIIDYADEEKYNAIRITERGRKYGPLHFEQGLFTKQNSKGFSSGSLVAVNYADVVEVRPEGRAYTLGNPDANWQEGVSLRRTVLPIENLTELEAQQYLSNLKKQIDHLGVKSTVAIVDPRYILLMLNVKDLQAAQSLDSALVLLESGRFKKIDHISFDIQKHGTTQLAPGSGINVRFESEVYPRNEIIDVVLKEIGRSKIPIGGRCEKLFSN
ncbi:MAG: phospholipase D-like domain-containing protein [Bdellovibrionota bacterium]